MKLEEAAENILPERLLMILHWYISHSRIPTNDELHDLSIYPFLMYANNQLISVGYLDHFDMDFLYLTDTQNIDYR